MELLRYLSSVLLLGFLFIAAWIDLKTGTLPLVFLVAGFVTGVILQLLRGAPGWQELLWGWVPGGALLFIAFLSEHRIGAGDGALFLVAGAFLGVIHTIVLLLFSLLAAAGMSVVLILLKKKQRKEVLPFGPFVLTGYILMLASI